MKPLLRIPRANLHYVLDAKIPPVATIKPNTTVLVETEDCASGLIRCPEAIAGPKASAVQYGNPVTGPIAIEGANPGDTVAIRIEAIEVDDQALTMFWGGSGIGDSHLFPQRDGVISPIRDGKLQLGERFLPIRPMIGTIGTAPDLESLASCRPGPHGGNMDCPEIIRGSTLYLPVFQPGALVFMGDVHALQGDGEFCGTCAEVRAEVVARFEILPNVRLTQPRLEHEEAMMSIASARTFEEAAHNSFHDLLIWLEQRYSMSKREAYMLLTLVGELRVCQVVNSLITLRCRISKRYFNPQTS